MVDFKKLAIKSFNEKTREEKARAIQYYLLTEEYKVYESKVDVHFGLSSKEKVRSEPCIVFKRVVYDWESEVFQIENRWVIAFAGYSYFLDKKLIDKFKEVTEGKAFVLNTGCEVELHAETMLSLVPVLENLNLELPKWGFRVGLEYTNIPLRLEYADEYTKSADGLSYVKIEGSSI